MTVDLVVAFTIVAFLLLLLASLPVAYALGASGSLGLLMLDGDRAASAALEALPMLSSAKYGLIVLPLFILMGVLLAETGMAREIFATAERMLGWLPGGLAVSTVFACTMFGGVSGSSTADAATIGRVSMKEMSRHGYAAPYSSAVVAAAGTIAILIPPSIIMIIYGILTGESIGRLLVAGLVPGIIMLIVFSSYVIYRGVRLRQSASALVAAATVTGEARGASNGPDGTQPVEQSKPRPTDYMGLGYALALFVVVIGGIYTGFFTSTEAAAAGAFLAIIICVLSVRRVTALASIGRSALGEACQVTGMMFAILLGGAIFTYFLVSAGIPGAFTDWILALDVPPTVVVILLIGILIPLGMFLDGLSTLLVTVPLSYPVITELGYDGIWFGVVCVVAVEIGLLTPPVGLNVFVIAGLPGAPKADKIFAAVLPFIALQLLVLGFFIAFPDVVTWLPDRVSL
jgi:C4-dicarboxylate transporter DctM subunit